MSELLRELVGREVSVWNGTGIGQSGVIKSIGGRWLHLASMSVGTLLIPAANIRLIKVNQGGMTAQASTGGLQAAMLGQRVTVGSKIGDGVYHDTGDLEAFDEDWLRVGAGGSQLYFAIDNVAELRLS